MKASIFLDKIKKLGIDTIAGVPDSTLKQLCDAICLDQGKTFQHYVTHNEGAAVYILQPVNRLVFICRIPAREILLIRWHQ